MSVLSIRRAARRHRRHVAVLAALVILAGAIAVHHSSLPLDGHDDMSMAAGVELCLGVFTAVGAALVATGLALVAIGRLRAPWTLRATAVLPAPRAPVARARHGPSLACVLCVSRR